MPKIKHNGKCLHRLKQNPLEKIFHDEWQRCNDQYRTLDYLLADETNNPRGEVTKRDVVVAATVIQWLGSPCGQSFLIDVITKDEDFLTRLKRG